MTTIDYIQHHNGARLFQISGAKVVPVVSDIVKLAKLTGKYRVVEREISHSYGDDGYAHEVVTCHVVPV